MATGAGVVMKRVHQRQRDKTSCRQRLLIAAAALALQGALVASLRADVIHLKDGSRLEGEITKTDAGWVVREPSGKITKVTSDRVRSIEAKRQVGPDDATQRLASLRRSTANLDDIQKILDRYHAFLQQHKGTPAADEARRDADEWEQRLREGREKFGDRWVTPEERESIRALSLVAAGDARRLMLQGRLRDAEPL